MISFPSSSRNELATLSPSRVTSRTISSSFSSPIVMVIVLTSPMTKFPGSSPKIIGGWSVCTSSISKYNMPTMTLPIIKAARKILRTCSDSMCLAQFIDCKKATCIMFSCIIDARIARFTGHSAARFCRSSTNPSRSHAVPVQAIRLRSCLSRMKVTVE